MQNKFIVTIRRDRILLAWGVSGLVLGVLLLIYMNTSAWAVKEYTSIIKSPTFFPNISIWGLIVMSALLVLTALKQTAKIKAENTVNPATVSFNIYGIVMIAIWAGFIVLNSLVGFVIASIICILATEWLCGVNMKSATPYLIAIIAPLVFYFLFGKLLKVRFTSIPFIG